MFNRARHLPSIVLWAACAALFGAHGCAPSSRPPEPEGALKFRIENYTSSFSEVTITVSVPTLPAPAAASVDPITTTQRARNAVASITLQALNSAAVVRVPAAQLTDGVLACGNTIMVTATVGATASPVMLEGDGTGTAGFDAGSVGPSGERLLFFADDYGCADTIVIQITDASGPATGAAGSGRVRVYPGSVNVPVPDFSSVPVEDTSDADAGADGAPVTTGLRVENRTSSLVQVEFMLGGTLVSDGSSGDGGGMLTVRVPAGEVTNGSSACASRLSIAAFVVSQTVSADGVSEGMLEVVLTGSGTGTPGFDEGSVGTDYTRQLELHRHFQCGASVMVTITEDGISFDADGHLVYNLGAGTVTVAP